MNTILRSPGDPIVEAEAAVDSRYEELGRVLHLPWHVSAYVLSSLVCAHLRREQLSLLTEFSSGNAASIHEEVRSTLEGLHFALRAQPRPKSLVPGEVGPDLHELLLDGQLAGKSMAVLNEAKAFARVRDGFIAVKQGSCVASVMEGKTIRFDLHPAWKGGHRHTAETELRNNTDFARLQKSLRLRKLEDVKRLLVQSVELPRDIPMGGIDSGDFIDIHIHLSTRFRMYDPDPTPVRTRDQLLDLITGCERIGRVQGARFLELVTYDPSGKPHIDNFCCPVLRLTQESYLVLVPAQTYLNLRYAVPKLVIHRGPGMDEYSEKMESYVTDGLVLRYQKGHVLCKTRLAYKSPSDRGDIDFVLYDAKAAALLLAQVKAFVPPDSIVDVESANEKMAEGITQAERVQRWFAGGGADTVFSVLGEKCPNHLNRVVFAVIGNAFAGSDCLSVPKGITLLGSDCLLHPVREAGSIFEAIDEQTRAIQDKTAATQAGPTEYTTVELAGWRFEFPFRWSSD